MTKKERNDWKAFGKMAFTMFVVIPATLTLTSIALLLPYVTWKEPLSAWADAHPILANVCSVIIISVAALIAQFRRSKP